MLFVLFYTQIIIFRIDLSVVSYWILQVEKYFLSIQIRIIFIFNLIVIILGCHLNHYSIFLSVIIALNTNRFVALFMITLFLIFPIFNLNFRSAFLIGSFICHDIFLFIVIACF